MWAQSMMGMDPSAGMGMAPPMMAPPMQGTADGKGKANGKGKADGKGKAACTTLAVVSSGNPFVDQVKELQRKDFSAKGQWITYCNSQGDGKRDPAQHTDEFLMFFLANRHTIEATSAPELVDMMKEGQRRSPSWRQAWGCYRMYWGLDGDDPSKADSATLEAFLEFLGQSGLSAMMMGVDPNKNTDGKGKGKGKDGGKDPWSMGPGAKKPRAETDYSDPVKGALVDAVKQYQRGGELEKQAWSTYCDTFQNGTKDPSRIDAEALQQFLTTYGVPSQGS